MYVLIRNCAGLISGLDETIQAHLVIVFASLAICKYIEIKTGMSIYRILKLAEKAFSLQHTYL